MERKKEQKLGARSRPKLFPYGGLTVPFEILGCHVDNNF